MREARVFFCVYSICTMFEDKLSTFGTGNRLPNCNFYSIVLPFFLCKSIQLSLLRMYVPSKTVVPWAFYHFLC